MPHEARAATEWDRERLGQTELLRQPDALQLARWPYGDLLHDEDLARHLEVRQTNRGELSELLVEGLGPFAKNHGGRHVFTEHVVRNAKRDALVYCRVLQDDLVHLARGDLFAAAVDDLLEPPGDGDVTVGVHRALVARPEPPLDERLGVGFWVV